MANEAPDPGGRLARSLGHPAALLLLTAVLTGLPPDSSIELSVESQSAAPPENRNKLRARETGR